MSSTLAFTLLFTFLSSLVSLTGGILILSKEKLALKLSYLLAAFAGGALLGVAFFDLLPEAFEIAEGRQVATLTLVGIIAFFLIERFIRGLRYHTCENCEDLPRDSTHKVYPLILGDTICNFIDGVTIAGTFLLSIPLGITTAFIIAAHEIPQEMAEFSVLFHKGLVKRKIIMFNILSGFSAILGALLTFLIGQSIENALPILLALAAGGFIYISVSEIIPELHEQRKGFAFLDIAVLLLGVLTVWTVMNVFAA